MKIAVLAANGKAGKLIVKEAVERGHDVTAVVREENQSLAKKVITKDLLKLTKEDLAGFDAVISAFGAWTEETLPLHTTVSLHLLNILSGTNARLLFVGGAASLYLDDTLTTQLFETPEFPEEYKPVASAMKAALVEIRKNNDVKWTYISPAAEFIADGERKGDYLLAGEVFTVNKDGKSEISYADYALAMLDEVEKGNNIKKRISVLWK